MAASSSGLKPLFIISDRYHGRGKVTFQWNAGGTFMCSAGSNGIVHIFDRHGAQVTELQLESRAPCLAIDWDKDGEAVAILQQGVDRVAVWELTTRSVLYVDTALKDPTFLKWSKKGPQLAIGSGRGGLVIFRRDSRKKLPITGKHTKAIICGDWSRDNQLALGGADNLLTLSSADGDTIDQTELKYNPVAVQFATQKTDSRSGSGDGADSTVSINMGGKSILLFNLSDPEHPVELAFQQKYGRIVTYRWFGDGYMMIGFSEGYVVVISTHMKEVGEELFSGKFHKEGLEDIACSLAAGRAASAGGNTIKLIDMNGWKEAKGESAQVDPVHGPLDSVAWTPDGQILTAATRSGHIYAFLAKMPVLTQAHGSAVAYLSSLREVSIFDTLDPEEAPVAVEVAVEPACVALGPAHVAVAMNNKVWYYRRPPAASGGSGAGGGARLHAPIERDYVATVDDVRLTERQCAVLSGGRVYVQEGEASGSGGGGGRALVLPDREDGSRATCIATAGAFLFCGMNNGTMAVVNMNELAVLPACELRLPGGSAITGIFPNALGTRVVVLDATSGVYLYNPTDGKAMVVPDAPRDTVRALWDLRDRHVFVLATSREAATYLYSAHGMTGPSVAQLGALEIQANGDMLVDPVTSPIANGAVPQVLIDGTLWSYATSGKVTATLLATHEALNRSGRLSTAHLRAAFAQNVALLRFPAAHDLAVQLNDPSCWLALSGKAMECLDCGAAIRAYRHIGDVGMVQALERIAKIEDRQAAAGHIALLFGDYPLAQELLLSSSDALAALELRKDLLQWDQALKLAETMAPEQVPAISVELAKQLEFKGEHLDALTMYQQAQKRAAALPARTAASRSGNAAINEKEDAAREQMLTAIRNGIARTTIRSGDVRRGMSMVLDSGDAALCRDCGSLLEAAKQLNDAAALYKAGGMFDKAAALYLQGKNYGAAAPLMDKVSSPKLHIQYAKAKEAAREYMEAAKSYERARDLDAVVRLLIEQLAAPERAADIVRQTRSSEGATLVASYCRAQGNVRGAIEFLLLARKRDEAFELASSHKEMGLYVQALRTALAGPAAAPGGADTAAASAAAPAVPLPAEECGRVAGYYESKGELAAAAAMQLECKAYAKALRLYLAIGESAIGDAIKVVGAAKSDVITHTLIDYLTGETDGQAKDPRLIFQLYMALENYPQAAKTALIIATQESDLGNYKVAHSLLFETYAELRTHGVRIPAALLRTLTLLHSYLLVKKLVKADNHEAAARMTVRVAKNISKFPAHVVPILTSTVIECQRAGMKRSAFEYAVTLMRPEYRKDVEEKFAKKIEALVRRPSDEEAEEAVSPCPFCDTPLPATELNCGSCKNTIPFCIVTGKHMTLEDCSSCPSCRFPALYSALTAHVRSEGACPMCNASVLPAAITLVREPLSYLREAAGAVGEDEGGGGSGGGGSSSLSR